MSGLLSRWKSLSFRALAVTLMAVGANESRAQTLAMPAAPTPTDIWTLNASGNWNTAGNWSAGVPASGTSTILLFPAVASTYTATDNISGTFTFSSLEFDGDGSSAITIAGNTLSSGAGPAGIVQDGTAPVTISNTITGTGTTSGSPLTFSGYGSGSVTVSGAITQTEGVAVNALTPITVNLSNNNNTFGAAANVTYGREMASAGSVLEFTGSAAAGNTPLGSSAGSGGYWMNAAGTIDLAPSGANGAVTETLGTSYYYDSLGGGLFELNKGSNTSLNVTLDAFLYFITGANGADGTLTFVPASGIANFGTSSGEKITLTAGYSDVNGMIVPTTVSQASATDTTGYFLTGTTTPKEFTAYTNTYSTSGGAFDTGTAGTQIDAVNANTTTAGGGSGNAKLFSMNISNSTLTISSGDTVTMNGGAFNSGHAPQSGIILNNTSSAASIAGPGTLAFGLTEGDFYVSAGTATVSANITSTLLPTSSSPGPALVKFGPGTLALTGTNSFASGAFITSYGGLISFAAPGSGDPAALGGGAGTIDLLMGGGGGYQLTGGSYTPSAKVIFGMVTDGSTGSYIDTGGGTIDVEGAGNTLTLAQSGQFFDQTTGNPLYKTGAGKLAFGAAYSLLSPTVINGGIVAINANMTSTGTGQFVVNNTGALQGTGTAYGRVTLTSGGTIQPGSSTAIGKLTLGGSSSGAVFDPGGIYQFAYNPDATSPTAGTSNDEIASSSSTLDLSNLSATNQFDLNLDPTNSDTPNGVTYIAGVFSSIILPTGVTQANAGTLFDVTGAASGTPTISENGTELLVSFAATPEPVSLSIFGLIGGGLLMRRRRQVA